MKKKKVAFYLSHPIQYFSPLLVKIAEKADVNVVYFSDVSIRGGMDKGFGRTVKWDTPLLQGYHSSFLKNYAGYRAMDNRFFDAINPRAIGAVRKEQAKVIIINGWSYFSTWLVIIAAKFFRKKIWLRAESPLNQELQKSKKIIVVKKWLLGKFLFYFFVDKCLYIGSESKKFFNFYGVPDNRLIYTPYSVDNDYFSNAWQNNQSVLPGIKIKLGLPADRKIILFTGKFIEKKRPLDLLRAFRKINSGDYYLVMVGDGELKPQLISFIEENNLQADVLLTGFINQKQIPDFYSLCDVFVMCSGIGETWGLSVNEAMNFEKPVIVSSTCGCSADLVKQKENGFVFEEGNIKQLASCLQDVLQNDAMRISMGKASGKLIKNFSVNISADNLCSELYE